MSNEAKDWLNDLKNSPVKSRDWNRWFLYEYPWMTPCNAFSGKRITDCAGPKGDKGFWPGTPEAHPEYDYEYTLADDFPDGWWDSFGLQMCDEIDKCLKQLPEQKRNGFRVTQIKEKFGTLRFYVNWGTDDIYKVIDKYTKVSSEICQKCGKPATRMNLGWIGYFCDNCASKNSITMEEAREEDEEDDGPMLVSIEPRTKN